MSRTKNYVVKIYNGQGVQNVCLRAISINAAKAAGKEYIRDMHIAGGTVLSAEKAR